MPKKAYANATGDWKKVIELSDELVPIYRNAGIDSSVTIQDLRIKAKAYFNLGDTLKGVKCLQDFISRYIKNTEAETKSKLQMNFRLCSRWINYPPRKKNSK